MLSGTAGASAEDDRRVLLRTLEASTQRLSLLQLSSLGMGPSDIGRVVAHNRGSSMATSPVVLTDEEIARILTACM